MTPNLKFQYSLFYLLVLTLSSKWKRLSKKKEIDSESNLENHSLTFLWVKAKTKLQREELSKVTSKAIGSCFKIFTSCQHGSFNYRKSLTPSLEILAHMSISDYSCLPSLPSECQSVYWIVPSN